MPETLFDSGDVTGNNKIWALLSPDSFLDTERSNKTNTRGKYYNCALTSVPHEKSSKRMQGIVGRETTRSFGGKTIFKL